MPITNIPGNQKLKDSRAVINQNFQDLDNEKSAKTDVQKSTHTYAVATGSGNAYAVTLTPAPASYTAGLRVDFKANHTNTGAATLNVNGLGAKAIKKNGIHSLEANDLEDGGIYSVIYDGTNFQLLSQLAKKWEEKDLKASAQAPPDLTLRVAKGYPWFNVYFAGGNSGTFAIPTTNPRIDVLILNSDGNLEIISGVEAASPSPPGVLKEAFIICEVYNRPTQTVIKNENDGVNGYIYRDIRRAIRPNEGFFTYGETIAVNDAVYLKASDGKVYKTNAAYNDERIHNFVGFAKEAGNANDVKKVQIGGKVGGFSGLTVGADYYLSNTAGQISTTPGTNKMAIGIALSATELIIHQAARKKYVDEQRLSFFSGSQVFSGNSPTSWTDLNLSAVVGAKNRIVVLKIRVYTHSSTTTVLAFRRKGDSDEFVDANTTHAGVFRSTTYSTTIAGYVVVPTDSAGVIQWKTYWAGLSTTIWVEAYI